MDGVCRRWKRLNTFRLIGSARNIAGFSAIVSVRLGETSIGQVREQPSSSGAICRKHFTSTSTIASTPPAPFKRSRHARKYGPAPRLSPVARPDAPTVLVETETVDTGERRELFGRPARHVITKRGVIPLTGSRCRESQTVTDGWSIDLDTSLFCDPWRWSSGSGHAFLTTHTKSHQPERPTFADIGESERGYVVPSRSTPGASVLELEVTHLSTLVACPR